MSGAPRRPDQKPDRGRILLVDDEPRTRDARAERLRAAGFQVETAADGRTALPLIPEFRPHLLVTEEALPWMSGLELMREAHGLDPDLEVVVLADHGSIASAVELVREGASDYLAHPVEPEQLHAALDRALERRRERQEVRPQHLIAKRRLRALARDAAAGPDSPPAIPGSSLAAIERHAILSTLELTGGSTSQAARILGISPRKIQYRMNEYRSAS